MFENGFRVSASVSAFGFDVTSRFARNDESSKCAWPGVTYAGHSGNQRTERDYPESRDKMFDKYYWKLECR